MAQVKHFHWTYGDESGRVAVRVDTAMNEIEVQQIAGKAPPWDHRDATCIEWSNVLNTSFCGPNDEPLRVYAQNVSATRKNRFAIEMRRGMSGVVKYLLRSERNAALHDYPIEAALHVSCAGKLNNGMKLWLGNWAELNSYQNGCVSDETLEAEMSIVEVPTLAFDLDWQQAEPWPAPRCQQIDLAELALEAA
jgi:hypothetical protein